MCIIEDDCIFMNALVEHGVKLANATYFQVGSKMTIIACTVTSMIVSRSPTADSSGTFCLSDLYAHWQLGIVFDHQLRANAYSTNWSVTV